MAQVNITLNYTAKELARLERVLVRVNAQRAAFSGMPTGGTPTPFLFATVIEWISSECQQLLNNHVESEKDRERQSIISAYAVATDAQKDQINSILGIS